ncbi:acyl-CoA dehydrogenase family protein [Mycolicibacter hiberniae]|uniref:Acyl-CoA dehydrogenase n=1 Tax=Mycolicibacter hiberniae TaxID=29314 RepID=A0A7I7X0P6_9MYCO|nr:acyl-CoA dehydrogenase family protein [Mycolicibacter hiberniae]MCV7086882.1 acyl-CoA dehydrogenase family protein [Mycolicibacter hiberniae]ORV70874.1 acyl-CoA dehydrogenase [Mycolicibacter hiberniae]BBZ21818.1 acyl-CoA dehydrogenase [Mycolicibacter hiberniae]
MTLDFDMGPRAAELRSQLRELIERELPPRFPGAFTDDPADLAAAQRFCRALAEQELLCLSWPQEFGGAGASVWEQTVVREEMWAHHEPRGAQYMGVNWVGPILMRHGTPEQQHRHLPPIAAGEVIWCQGFSEPEAGSDLASLRTYARRDGDGWLINGQKIWTSYATMAQWCFLLVRTTRVGEGSVTKKQQGLTVFLVPMDDPAITVRPLGTMMGPHHLNEVFFDDLRVTDADVLGEVDAGWSIVADVMAFERVGIARYARCERLLAAAPHALGQRWDALPAELIARWVRMFTHCRRARLMAYRVVSLQAGGRVAPGDAAAYRIAVTRLDHESAEVLMEITAEAPATPLAQWFRQEVEDHWRYSQAATVSSGSIEMQRILLSRALLAAPR